MLFLLVSLSIFAAFGHCEHLPEHRESCVTGHILRESSNFLSVRDIKLDFLDNRPWQDALNAVCKRTYNGLNGTNQLDYDSRASDKVKVIEKMIMDLEVDPKVWELARNRWESEGIVGKMNYSSLEYYFQLNYRFGKQLQSAKCNRANGHDDLSLTAQLMEPELFKVRKCDDIGTIVKGKYEFYEIPNEWMFDRGDGALTMVDLSECEEVVQNNEPMHFCSRFIMDTFPAAHCSIKATEKCHRKVVKATKEKHSIFRQLVDGMAIFGSFKKWSVHSGKETQSHLIDPSLYYLGYQNLSRPMSTVVTHSAPH